MNQLATYATKLLIPYLRVSTDDKGQDPQRQMLAIAPWAEREGFTLLEPAIDNGTSASKVPALKRGVFLEACERAKAARAQIVMEVPDRFSRQDPDIAIWEKVEVERRYGVHLYFACMTLDMQRTPLGKVMLCFQQSAGHIWVEDHRSKILSGNIRARARGQRLGRAPKKVDFDEEELIVGWRKDEIGWETIANRINLIRVPTPMTDKKAERAKKISPSALKRWWAGRNGQKTDSTGPEIILADTPATERSAIAEELHA